ncbi:hypothetical protein BH24ACT3_BH24ACT3_09640 [soil metagenome]
MESTGELVFLTLAAVAVGVVSWRSVRRLRVRWATSRSMRYLDGMVPADATLPIATLPIATASGHGTGGPAGVGGG